MVDKRASTSSAVRRRRPPLFSRQPTGRHSRRLHSLEMASYIRSTTSFALAPLRATHGLLSATYGLVSRTGSEARGLVQGGLEYIRRDRTAPAAALVGLGPLLLGVIRDEKTERALQELMQLLKDALAILQREEVHTITATVKKTDTDSHARGQVVHLREGVISCRLSR